MDIGAVAPAVGQGSGPNADSQTRDLEDGVHFVVGKGEWADGRDRQCEDFVGFADDLCHADDGARLGGILHAGTLQGFGGERQGVAVHGEGHQIAGHIAGGEEGCDGVTIFQCVEQARGVADILNICESFSAANRIQHIARAAEVMEVEIPVAETFDRPAAPAHRDFLACVGDTFFHQFRWKQDAILFDTCTPWRRPPGQVCARRKCARTVRGEQVARAGMVDDNSCLVQDAERGVVNGFDGGGGKKGEHGSPCKF